MKNLLTPFFIKETALCPYCDKQLPKFPTRKSNCPFCKNTFYVRTEPFTRKKIIIKSSQIEQNKKDWEEYFNISEFEKNLKNIEETTFTKLYKQQAAILEKRFLKTPSIKDILWGISNQMIIENIRNREINLRSIYWAQSMFLYNEGRDYGYIMQKDHELELKELQKTSFKTVEIITAGDQSCKECQTLSGKIFTIEEVLQNKFLPCPKCTFGLNSNVKKIGWCRCQYSAHVD